MANLVLVLLPLFLIINILSLPLPAPAISSCNGPCKSLNNYTGQLICIEGTRNCKGKSFSQFKCSPPRVVALSTGWFDGGSRYGKMIKITASNGRSVKAKMVDECDSMNGCDAEHADQPSCKNNIVDGSNVVWNDLGLNLDDGVGPVTWSLA
ncbi:hypothetical protein CIPAW_13G111600 [Carya illinoinensis]|uniref:Kiwellin-like n=1 Tax=Carya illinoinensis TaxID=32201 RepID=A0A8T1NQC3_CARIL|nr:hypothetical protein CIPAW_13G111600 [Carya illinoinensis]KAG6681843.1 hypothetical protein I3842_13G110400 [Carya illinoinensis]